MMDNCAYTDHITHRHASQYGGTEPPSNCARVPPTCDAFSDFVDEHLEKLESNALLACL